MKNNKTFTVKQRRRQEGKTDYRKRLKLIMSGKPRLVVRRSSTMITAQIIKYEEKGDKIVATVRSDALKKLGWNYNLRNIPSAYLVGLLIAQKAKENSISEAILDIGLNKAVPGSRLFAVLKGAIDNGLNIPHSADILPSDDRIAGKHVESYAQSMKEKKEEYDKRFSGYIKNQTDPSQISKQWESVKQKIMGA